MHCGVNPGGPCHEHGGLGGATADTATLWHEYSIELDNSTSPAAVRWYLDGKQYWSVNETTVGQPAWGEATAHGFFIILDLAIGGGWAGNPTNQTMSGGTMEIDWIAVYTSA